MSAQALDVVVRHDPGPVEFDWAVAQLRRTYGADARPAADYLRAFTHSVCVAAFFNGKQVGFGRAVTDRAIVAYVSDVIVAEDQRGQGVGKAIVCALLDHPELVDVYAWSLRTDDAHGLYARFGFVTSDDGHFMRMLRERPVTT